MSPDNAMLRKPSLCRKDEGCQEIMIANRQMSGSPSHGVSGDDTLRRLVEISWDVSLEAGRWPQPAAQGVKSAEAVRARGEVGVLRSSDEPSPSKSGGSEGRAL